MAPPDPVETASPKHSVGAPVQGQVLSKAERISQSLKDVSRQIRRPIWTWTTIAAIPQERLDHPFKFVIVFAFIAGVIVPVALSGFYLALFASDQYASEARFAVRGGESRGQVDPIAALTGVTSTVRIQDSQIVAEYIRGRGMVEELERSLNLREMFASPKADFVFSFNPTNPIEKLVRYWWWQVDVDVDRISGIITVIVRAFTPQDALAVTKAVIAASEKLVNDLSERSRRDSLKQAQSELVLAENVLQDRLKAMRDLRNRDGVLDIVKTSEALTKVVADMRLELSRMESEYAAQRKQNVSEASPQMRVLEARIRSTREQIRLVEARMAGGGTAGPTAPAKTPDGNPVLADSLSRFDRLRLEQDFAQKQYVTAAAALERARMEVEAQQVYLATFLQPVLAEEALYPKRWWILAAITAICLVLWGAGVGVAVLIRNHAA